MEEEDDVNMPEIYSNEEVIVPIIKQEPPVINEILPPPVPVK